MARLPGVRPIAAAVALAAVLAGSAEAQGGWRQWEIRLRDGTRIEANPLGAPDDLHLSISVGGLEGRDATIPRSRIDYIAAQSTVGPGREPIPGVTLPDPPAGRVCQDVVVRRDGRRSTGRVTLKRVAFSEGVVLQRGDEIDLRDVAYLKFAESPGKRCGPRVARPSRTTWPSR